MLTPPLFDKLTARYSLRISAAAAKKVKARKKGLMKEVEARAEKEVRFLLCSLLAFRSPSGR